MCVFSVHLPILPEVTQNSHADVLLPAGVRVLPEATKGFRTRAGEGVTLRTVKLIIAPWTSVLLLQPLRKYTVAAMVGW